MDDFTIRSLNIGISRRRGNKVREMIRFGFVFLLVLLSLQQASATPDSAGERQMRLDFRSDVLGENREFLVQLPESYFDSPEKRFPVFYVTDADWNFSLVSSTLDYLSFWGRIPEFIVVGEINTSRNKDFLPAADPGFPNSGGGDLYLTHIKSEWIPFVDANFRTSGKRVLFGHSFGGVVTLNQLFSEPDLFDAYIALSSSVWVADRIMFERAQSAFQSNLNFDRYLYLSVGEGDGGMTVPDGDKFAQLLSEEAPKELEWRYKTFAGENHFTNVPISLHDALAELFPFWGYDEEVRQAGMSDGADGVRAWFRRKEQELGWRFTPQSMELSLAAFRLASSDQWNAANALFDRLQEIYPDRPEILAVRANALKANGRLEEADAAIAKAIALGERVGHWPDRLQSFRDFKSSLAE